MKIILLKKIFNLGNIGNIIKVKSGYARNYLIPNGKACLANKKNIIKYKKKEYEFKNIQKKKYLKNLNRCKRLKNLGEIIIFRSGHKGKLFGSVGIKEIVKCICSLGFLIYKKELHLPNGTFRKFGVYEIYFQPSIDISFVFKINIKNK
ncbi:50S ribosomal protein L9 [Buchnera aphidicola]|uniref:50S ribosomal protein L9 n=1 Tax=Buchnera aphidicola TaxID=9 RepID=UPI0031B80745